MTDTCFEFDNREPQDLDRRNGRNKSILAAELENVIQCNETTDGFDGRRQSLFVLAVLRVELKARQGVGGVSTPVDLLPFTLAYTMIPTMTHSTMHVNMMMILSVYSLFRKPVINCSKQTLNTSRENARREQALALFDITKSLWMVSRLSITLFTRRESSSSVATAARPI